MRDNMRAPVFQTMPSQTTMRTSYGYQDAGIRPTEPKYFKPEFNPNNNKINHYPSDTHNYMGKAKNPQPKFESTQGTFKKTNDSEGSQNSRKNSSESSQFKVNNNNNTLQQQQQQLIEESQRQADLRGSCPNIFKKMQQTGLRSTAHWGGLPKFNLQLEHNNRPPPTSFPANSFLKTPKATTLFNSPVTHSVLVGDDQQKQKSQILVKNNKPASKSAIENFNKNGYHSFMSNKHNNASQNGEQTGNNRAKVHFKSLNEIIGPKGHKKSEQVSEEELTRYRTQQIGGSKIVGQFELDKILGKGKFGQVYLGRHKRTGFVVALKRIIKSKVREFKMVDQLRDEIKIHQSLNHPNIVRFFGCFQDGDDLYLVIEYMNGGTLFDYLADRNKLSVREAADFLRDTITALQYLHEKSIAHRDIKPENIVLSTEGVAKLCDLGWAAMVEGSRKTYCGTFDYAPPEILERKNYDSSVDIWCIGVLTYELLTGKVPFEGEVRNQIMQKIINVDKAKIDFPPQIPQCARDFIESLVRKDPSERPKCKQLLKHQFFLQNPPASQKKKGLINNNN